MNTQLIDDLLIDSLKAELPDSIEVVTGADANQPEKDGFVHDYGKPFEARLDYDTLLTRVDTGDDEDAHDKAVVAGLADYVKTFAHTVATAPETVNTAESKVYVSPISDTAVEGTRMRRAVLSVWVARKPANGNMIGAHIVAAPAVVSNASNEYGEYSGDTLEPGHSVTYRPGYVPVVPQIREVDDGAGYKPPKAEDNPPERPSVASNDDVEQVSEPEPPIHEDTTPEQPEPEHPEYGTHEPAYDNPQPEQNNDNGDSI